MTSPAGLVAGPGAVPAQPEDGPEGTDVAVRSGAGVPAAVATSTGSHAFTANHHAFSANHHAFSANEYAFTANTAADEPKTVVIPHGMDGLLSTSPCFRPSLRGYDRVQVDNYVAWAETELSVARRQVDDLLSRLGACAVELEAARRGAVSRDDSGLPAPIVELLRRAADEAGQVSEAAVGEARRITGSAEEAARRTTEEAAAEADRILADAQLEAEARLRKADAIVEAATAAAEERLAAAEREVAELRRQRDEARESLHVLTSRIGEALHGALVLVDDGVLASGRAVTSG